LLCVAFVDVSKCNERNSEPSTGEQALIQCRSQWPSPCSSAGENYSNVLKCEYIIQPFCRTQLFANDFFNRCVSCFNGLPESVVSSNTVVEFKHRLSEVDLSFFKSTILIIVLVICSGYANNPVYTINLSMYLYHFILYVFALVFKFMNE